MYDIIVVGAGPAGLTAALYALRADKTVLVLEKSTFGGQITFSPQIENYPGYVKMSGNELADKLVEQVIHQGAEIEMETVTHIIDNGEYKTVVTEEGEHQAKAVIIATGVRHRQIGLPNEDSLIGSGVSYCAVCDGAFFRDQTVAVLGGGGKDFIPYAKSAGADAFLTGEASYNALLDSAAAGLVTITAGHYYTEAPVLQTLKNIIGSSGFSGIYMEEYAGKPEIFTVK